MLAEQEKFGSSSNPRVLGIILARGGSKSVIKKNIRPLLGKPLIAYTICEALRSRWISRLIVSSDSEEIRRTAIQYGAQAPFVRPAELATDSATALAADQHALAWAEEEEGVPYDYVVELLCTNPMKTSADIDAALEKLMTTAVDSVIGVTKLEDHHPIRIKKIMDDQIVDFCLPEIPETHRQALKPDAYIRNGAIYAMKRDLLKRGSRYGTSDSRPYIMPAERSINIDAEIDMAVAEILLKKYPRNTISPVMTWEEAGKVLNRQISRNFLILEKTGRLR
ncbi:MAG: cytidylyltransferase [Omnitrophica WOR_2 bacterium RIFCSPHIGHO2_02_FULL_50_17]|nr:MAG: cytidylyltransferase [Omnitrophica WOR_2 bacterium RIFCSPHIGHO2_02_FULL_50_17]